jgi:hypothetical protein
MLNEGPSASRSGDSITRAAGPRMVEDLQAFLRESTPANFRRLRLAVLADPGYNGRSNQLNELGRLCSARQFAKARELAGSMMPCWLLSPRAHFLAGYAARETGDDDEAELAGLLMHACLRGILASGDGTPNRPYLVTHVSDEYDVIDALGQSVRTQTLAEANGRYCDVITCHDGRELWFDASCLFAARRSTASSKKVQATGAGARRT